MPIILLDETDICMDQFKRLLVSLLSRILSFVTSLKYELVGTTES